jgi:uncharacterized protein (TIGR02996 family)
MTAYDHPDYHALIRTIREIDRAPVDNDSTLARLVTADWLEERGEGERAAYIRWRSTDPTPFEHAPGDGAGSIVLLDPEGPPVEIELAPRHPGVQFGTAGGFVRSARCPLAWWLEHGPDLCRRHPLREVTITGVPRAERFGEITRWLFSVAATVPDHIERLSALSVVYSAGCGYTTPLDDLNTAALRWAESPTA